jgi:chitinase
MSVKRSVAWSRLAFGALSSAVGAGISVALLAAIPVQTASAQSTPTCAAAWSASAVYTGGNTASENGVNYKANWWTQGNDPATNNGGSGTGQPWTSQGACGGSGGGGTTNPPPPPPPPNNPPPAPGTLLFSAYKDITINMNWNTNVMQTAVTGSTIPIVGSGSLVSSHVPNMGAITLAFATGECGSENWGGVPGASFASANIPGLNSNGLNYVVSTGGQAGVFTCGSTAGMASFLSRYNGSHLVGIDFDIEGGQSTAQLNALVAAAVYAQGVNPNLRFSFTLATLAASDGSFGGLNSLGDTVVRAIKASTLSHYTINLMVMDFGSTGTGLCVVANGKCNMGQSAIQAALNLEHTYGIPASKIELTPMIGVNDTSSEVVSLTDVDTLTAYAVAQGMAGVHFWSLDRDTPCPGAQSTASSTCNSVSGSTALQYTNRFLHDLGR